MIRFLFILLLINFSLLSTASSQVDATTIANLLNTLSTKLPQASLTQQDFDSIKREENNFYIPKALRLKALFSFAQLSSGVQISRVTVNKSPIGFKFKTIPEKHVLNTLGFKQEDIVREVNGRPLRTEQDAQEIFKNSQSLNEVKVSLIREKQKKPIVLSYFFK